MLNTRAWATGLAVILFIVLGAFVMAQPNGTEATLVVTSGQAVVNQAGGAVLAGSVETAVSTGEVVAVHQGDTIRLADTATAQLRLLDGSTIDLSGGTVLAVSELVTNDQSYRARFSLLAGKTFNQVVRLLKPGDAFEIKTPSSTASVRGTIFTVEVRSSGETFFTVDEGVVRVTMGDQAVDVPVGNQVTAVVGQRLEVVPSGTGASPTDTPETIQEPAESPTETAVPTEDIPLPETEEPVDQAEPDGGEGEPAEDDFEETEADKELVCHIPPGSGGPGINIEVAAAAVPAHLAHGDYLGVCETPGDVPALVPTDTAVPAAPVATDTPIPPPPPPPPTNTPVPAPTATPDAGGLVTICHIPPGQPENAQTIQVPWEDLANHLDHGDSMGPCP